MTPIETHSHLLMLRHLRVATEVGSVNWSYNARSLGEKAAIAHEFAATFPYNYSICLTYTDIDNTSARLSLQWDGPGDVGIFTLLDGELYDAGIEVVEAVIEKLRIDLQTGQRKMVDSLAFFRGVIDEGHRSRS